jgi:hypothetical protein
MAFYVIYERELYRGYLSSSEDCLRRDLSLLIFIFTAAYATQRHKADLFLRSL